MMSSSKLPSPARSQGSLVTPRLSKPKRTRSVGSPAGSTVSGRLSALVQFKENSKDSFVLSPAPSRRSVLNDDTEIEEPRRKSWWRNLGENSRDVMEVLNDNKILETNEAVEEYIDIEVLSQEKKDYTIDLPESSDSESISSIVIPQRKLFTQKDLQAQNKFGQLIGTRETLAKLHKTNVADKTVNVAPKNLFGQNTKVRVKPVFPAALLNISPNKTANKTKELAAAEVKVQVRSLFGNRAGTKRKNMFADFIVSESEDEISDIQPKVFGFPKKAEQRRDSSASRGKREHSPTSSIATDIEMDEWQHLPSSTMVENQLEDMLTARTPVKRARLSQLAETKESHPETIAEHEKESEEESEELKYDDNENEQNELNDEKDVQIAQNRACKHFNENVENNIQNVSKNKELNQNRMGIECEIDQLAQEVNKSKTAIQNISKMTIENIKPSEVNDFRHISRNLSMNGIQDEVDNNLESQTSSHNISKTKSQTLNKSKSRNVSQHDTKEKAKKTDHEDNVSNLEQMVVETDEVPNKDKELNHDIIQERTYGAEEEIIGKELAETENKVLKAVIETYCVTSSEALAQDQIVSNVNQKENQNHTLNMEEMQVENEHKPQKEIKSEEREDNDEEENEKSIVNEELVETEVEEEEEHEETELDYEEDEEEAEVVLEQEDKENTEAESEEEEQVDDPKEEDDNELNERQSLEKSSKKHEKSQARGKHKSEMEKHEQNEIKEYETSIAKENENILKDEKEIEAEVQEESEVEVPPKEEDDEEAVGQSHVKDQDEVRNEKENEAESDNEAQNESQGGVQNKGKDEVQNKGITELQNESKVEAQDESQVGVQNESEDEVQNESEMEVQNESEVEYQDESEDEVQNESEMEVQNESEVEDQDESQVEIQNESENESEMEVQNESEVEAQNESEDEAQNESEDEAQNESEIEDQNESEDEEQNESAELQYDNETEEEVQIENNVDAQDPREDEIQDSNDLKEIQYSNNAEDSPNETHDTTGRYRKKLNSPEAILHDKTNQITSFTAQGRNTSIRKTTMLKNMNIRPSLAPPRDSTGLSDGTTNSSAEGSGWDSHRTTRKTMRQTFGKDFTPRKSLRTLVMEKAAKRQTAVTDITSVTSKFPQANSTEFPEASITVDEENVPDAVHDVSRRTRQTTLEMYLQKIKKQNLERKIKMEEAVKNSLKVSTRDHNPFKLPSKPLFSLRKQSSEKQVKPKAKTAKSTLIPLDDLPQEVIEDMKYKPPKRFQPSNASWITKRLYKFLESKLEPKYDYKARVRAEKLVCSIYQFAKDLRRHEVARADAVDVLKHEMARLDVVKTHFDFYQFFHDYMPREIRVKVVPDVVNKIGLPRHGVFSDILRGNNVQG